MNEIDKFDSEIKLYSSASIVGATFLGGPLAGGYLIGENFKAFGLGSDRKITFGVGIMLTILIFCIIFFVPDRIMEHIPNQIIPLIYTGIAYGVVQLKQGEALKKHANQNGLFFSGWRAAGIGVVSLAIFLIGIFGITYLTPENQTFEKYDTEIENFTKNEEDALLYYYHLQFKSRELLIDELANEAIPKWEDNVKIIEGLMEIKGLPVELQAQNEALLAYSHLRVEEFNLFLKAQTENTQKYESDLAQIHAQIDKILAQLNKVED